METLDQISDVTTKKGKDAVARLRSLGVDVEDGVATPQMVASSDPDADIGFIRTTENHVMRSTPTAIQHPYNFYIYTTDTTNLEGEITGTFSSAMPHEAFALVKSTTDDGRDRFSVQIVDYGLLPAPDDNKKLYITKKPIKFDDMNNIDRHLREAAAGRGVRPLANNSNTADQTEFSKLEERIALRFAFSAS